MNSYLIIKSIHILSSTIIFGTGIGIAFFMFRSHFTSSVEQKYYAISNTVLADYLFTFPAAVLQPATGAWLVWKAGFSWNDLWLLLTYILYFVAAICWIPVIFIQIKLKSILKACLEKNSPLPNFYFKLFRIWFSLGWPAFIALTIIFFLMVVKPI